MTVTKSIITRDELMFLLSLERAFTERWSSEIAHEEFASGRSHIPPMPRLEGLGKGTRYHLATVEEWLLTYFTRGGEARRDKKK